MSVKDFQGLPLAFAATGLVAWAAHVRAQQGRQGPGKGSLTREPARFAVDVDRLRDSGDRDLSVRAFHSRVRRGLQ